MNYFDKELEANAADQYASELMKFGQVRPTCSVKCGKWIKKYPKAKKPKKKNKERKPKIAPKPTQKAQIDRDESDPDLTDSDEFMGMHTGL